MAYNENIKIGDLLNHEEAFVVLQKHLPEFVSEPTFKMASNFTLGQLVDLPQVNIPLSTLEAIKNDLASIVFVAEKTPQTYAAPSSRKNDASLEGKVIIVIGAGSGIGRASAVLMSVRRAKSRR
ncbi:MULTISPECIES: hypothetical protein [Paenibacillus]|uniref:hypothetical protein n=1 Tax=Paenibacillus TaxID=44249 RepID=UPI00234B3516|nr:hypothetical protein [Paenibacillus polymyxa]WCM63761.1 hypothetical protein OYT09_12890 [Paenibacillus polymyxa]